MRSSQPPAAAPSLRTFVAIALPPPVKQGVEAEMRRLRQALERERLDDLLRWTHPDNLHLTLRFLGDTTPAQRAAVEAALAALVDSTPVFRLEVQSLGAFPSLRKPNILWLDFGGDLPVLGPLQAQIEAAAQAAGFPAEARAFAPHMTIARAHKDAAPLRLGRAGELLRAAAPPAAPPLFFCVEQIHLMRSDLRPSGPLYHALSSFPLAA